MNSNVKTMQQEKLVSVLAAAIGVGLVLVAISSAMDYRRAVQAESWRIAVGGEVMRRTDITSPSFRCFMRSARYSEIEYRYEDENGRLIRGFAQAPMQSEIYKGAAIRVKFNSSQPEQSLPEVSIEAYRTAYGLTAIFGLFASIGMAWAALRLWYESSKGALLSKLAARLKG